MTPGRFVRKICYINPMPATWLRTNTRAIGLGLIFPILVGLLGAALMQVESPLARLAGGAIAGISLLLVVLLLWQLRQPRLAYENGQLLVYLRTTGPIRVPIEVVECFLLGQTESLLPGRQHARTETASIVIRLSETAPEWSQREVKPALGSWCGGYITIRGTWCEPLSLEVVNRLNAQLAEVQSARRADKVHG
jgi:hypothetical protein